MELCRNHYKNMTTFKLVCLCVCVHCARLTSKQINFPDIHMPFVCVASESAQFFRLAACCLYYRNSTQLCLCLCHRLPIASIENRMKNQLTRTYIKTETTTQMWRKIMKQNKRRHTKQPLKRFIDIVDLFCLSANAE